MHNQADIMASATSFRQWHSGLASDNLTSLPDALELLCEVVNSSVLHCQVPLEAIGTEKAYRSLEHGDQYLLEAAALRMHVEAWDRSSMPSRALVEQFWRVIEVGMWTVAGIHSALAEASGNEFIVHREAHLENHRLLCGARLGSEPVTPQHLSNMSHSAMWQYKRCPDIINRCCYVASAIVKDRLASGTPAAAPRLTRRRSVDI